MRTRGRGCIEAQIPRATAIALMGALLVAPGIAISMSQNASRIMQGWAASDRCAAQAQKQFPGLHPGIQCQAGCCAKTVPRQ